MSPEPCPCGSGQSYEACCEPLHDGRAQAATAEQLMRSRYAAYARGRTDYVFRTWHPRTRPAEIQLVPGLVWTGLTVLDVVDGGAGDTEGTVEFSATFDAPDGPGALDERSRFVCRGRRWVYVDAEPEKLLSG